MKNDAKNKNQRKTIYEAIDRMYLKESKKITNEFLRMFKTNLDVSQNITN